MINKKIISLIITGALMGSYAPYVFAASNAEFKKEVQVTKNIDKQYSSKILKEQAKNISKQILKDNFNLEIDEKKYSCDVTFRRDEGAGNKEIYVWDIRWNYSSGKQNVNAWVSIDDATCKVVNIGVNRYEQGKEQQIARITQEEGKKIAMDFVKKIAPKEYKEVELSNYNPLTAKYDLVSYNFNFRRKINGIPFDGNSINVQVNGATSEVTSYNYTWDDNVKVPNKEDVISIDNAKKMLKDNTKMNLYYRAPSDKYGYYNKNLSTRLLYSPEYKEGYMVDASDGKVISYNPLLDLKPIVKNLTQKEMEEFYKKAAPLKNFEKELNREEAEKLASKVLKELYGNKVEVLGLNYREYSEEYRNYGETMKSWTANYKIKDGNDYKENGGNIEIDALNGAILNNYKFYYPEDNNFQPKISQEKAYKKAIDLLAKYYPDKIKDIKTEQVLYENKEYINGKEIPARRYYFNFPRVVSGITFQENNISISIDALTGEPVEMNSNWGKNITFPKPSGNISSEEAKELYMKKFVPELVYANINVSKDVNKPKLETKLVYKLLPVDNYGEFMSIDAFTGRYLDYTGEEIDDNIKAFREKIKGNKYEKELIILSNNAILDTKNFELNKEVTRMDIIKILVNAKGYRPYILRESEDIKFKTNAQKGDENYRYLQMAVFYEIIDNVEGEVNLNEKLTREEVAKILVKTLGYDKLAKANQIFNLPNNDSKDVSSNMKGYVAIVQGLNIMELQDNNFRPKSKATMLELAVAVYNSLGNLQREIY